MIYHWRILIENNNSNLYTCGDGKLKYPKWVMYIIFIFYFIVCLHYSKVVNYLTYEKNVETLFCSLFDSFIYSESNITITIKMHITEHLQYRVKVNAGCTTRILVVHASGVVKSDCFINVRMLMVATTGLRCSRLPYTFHPLPC